MIPEDQLQTWTGLGSVAQSRDTYATIRNVLLDQNAPYAAHIGEVFLQGSYGNDTNIYGDSDVDVVIVQKGLFYYNLDRLSPPEQAEFKRIHSDVAQYNLNTFRSQVSAWIARKGCTPSAPIRPPAVSVGTASPLMS
jgi:Nucleotidyltransferase domain